MRYCSLFLQSKKNSVFLNEKLASKKNALIIRSPERRKALFCATLAQLVERNLAKVEVTGSNPVCRSRVPYCYLSSNIDGRGMEQFGSSSGS